MLHTDIEIINTHRVEGKSTDTELLDFALMLLNEELSSKTIQANHKINDGISYLSRTGNWANLSAVTKHAIDEELTIAKKDKRMRETHIEIIQFKRDITHMGKADFINLLTEEAKEKYFKGGL